VAKWLKVAGLAVVALLVAASASGDSNTYNYQGSGPYFNTKNGSLVDASGNAKVVEVYPNRDYNFTYSNIINSASIAAAGADSSAVLDVHNMRLGTLLFKVTPIGGGTGLITRLAVQVRIHLNGVTDTLSVFAVYPYGAGPTFAPAVLDTMNAGHLFTGSGTVPWSGETILTFNGNRNSPLDAVAAVAFSYPNGVAIPLSSLTGRDFYADYISIRVRNVTGPAAKVAVSLIGSPN